MYNKSRQDGEQLLSFRNQRNKDKDNNIRSRVISLFVVCVEMASLGKRFRVSDAINE